MKRFTNLTFGFLLVAALVLTGCGTTSSTVTDDRANNDGPMNSTDSVNTGNVNPPQSATGGSMTGAGTRFSGELSGSQMAVSGESKVAVTQEPSTVTVVQEPLVTSTTTTTTTVTEPAPVTTVDVDVDDDDDDDDDGQVAGHRMTSKD